MEKILLDISNNKALQLAAWAEQGMKHRLVMEYDQTILEKQKGDLPTYWANFLGFAAVGKLGDPAKILEMRKKEGSDFLPFLGRVFEIPEDGMISVFRVMCVQAQKRTQVRDIIRGVRQAHFPLSGAIV